MLDNRRLVTAVALGLGVAAALCIVWAAARGLWARGPAEGFASEAAKADRAEVVAAAARPVFDDDPRAPFSRLRAALPDADAVEYRDARALAARGPVTAEALAERW